LESYPTIGLSSLRPFLIYVSISVFIHVRPMSILLPFDAPNPPA
jgi:hypothetical protein